MDSELDSALKWFNPEWSEIIIEVVSVTGSESTSVLFDCALSGRMRKTTSHERLTHSSLPFVSFFPTTTQLAWVLSLHTRWGL